MAESIDELQIEITASSDKASQSIDKLCKNMEKLKAGIASIDTSGFTNSMKTITENLKGLSNIKISGFSSFAKNINQLGSMDNSKVVQMSESIKKLGETIQEFKPIKPVGLTKLSNELTKFANLSSGSIWNAAYSIGGLAKNIDLLDGVSFNVSGLNDVAKSLSRFGGKSLTQATENLPKIKNDLSDFISGLNGVGEVTFNYSGLSNLISSISKLGGEKATQAAKNLPSMSIYLKKFVTDLNEVGSVAFDLQSLSELTNGISRLGGKAATQSIKNIPSLASAMTKLMSELSKAPKVSQNLIDMTNALANFARTGSSGGRAATSLGNSVKNMSGKFSGIPATMKRFDSAISKSVGKIKSFKSSILSAFGAVGGIYAAINGIKKSIDIASDLTEVQNVVDVTFGNFKDKIESLAAVSIPELGMSELTVKQIASRFQAMGTAMGIARGEMADMSVDLTRLAGDMSSFYNVAQEDVARSLQAVFTGETEPLRKYGLDLTQATIKEWALKNGIDADIKSMSQMEKTMLRYQYVMANTTAAQGDFIRTADTWAQQVRILKEQLKQLAGVLGTAFVYALKPLVISLNSALSSIISFAQTVVNALGKIFRWKIKISNSGIASDFDSAASGADDIAGSTGDAAKNVDKMKAGLRAFDELKTIDTGKDSGKGGGAGAAGGGASADDLYQLEETESAFKSKIKDLEGLGEYIGNALKKAMDNIKWKDIYKKASGFGSGLAKFLNGLFKGKKGETLFGKVGTTIAGALNTVLHSLDSFGKTFEWEQFGQNISDGINNFFKTFDAVLAADTINTWADGILTSLITAVSGTDWEQIGEKVSEFISNIDYGKLLADAIKLSVSLINAAVSFAEGLAEKFDASKILKSIKDALKDVDWSEAFESLMKSLEKIPGIGKLIEALDFTGIIDGFTDLIDTIENFDFSKWFKDDVKPWFTKEKWIELGTNAKDAIVKKVKEMVDSAKKSIENWWKDNVKPMFTKEKWEEIGKNIKSGFNAKWSEFKTWWNQTEVVNWWSKFKSNFDTDHWKSRIGSIKSAFSSKWSDFKTWWDGTAVVSWTSDFKKKFSTDKIKSMVGSFKSAIKSRWDDFKKWWNGLKLSFPKIKTPHFDITFETKTILGQEFKYPKKFDVKYYASGGFPEAGSFFWAGEKGIPEMLGTVGGKTAVAGGAEITGIRDAIYDSSQQEIRLLQEQNRLLRGILNKQFGITKNEIGRCAKEYAREEYGRTGDNVFVF